MKRDYYDLLGVSEQCTQDEIKQAYRKQALKCHPDKNPSEDAKEMFQELQEAYSVLSDPNERTWYDNHKNQILGKNLSSQDIELNAAYGFDIWHYFSPHFFGYDDSPNGFYAFYREAFEKIKIEEEKAFHYMDDGEEEYEKLPGFGVSTTNIEQVLKFYLKWENFTTYKVFGYADIYNPKEAPNRYYRRMIEKDNKKERQTEKKKYIKTIKQLVECVKNRDPRYKEYLELLKREEELLSIQKKKQMEIDRVAQQELLKEKRLAEQQRFQENEEYFRNLNQFEAPIEKIRSEEDYYCEICDKEFRSEQQIKNHNNSNQHKKNMKELIESITKDKKEQEELLKKVGMGVKIELNIDEKQLQEQVRQEVEREEQKKSQEQQKKKKQKKKKKKVQSNETQEESKQEQEEQDLVEDKGVDENIEESQDENEFDDLNRWKSFGQSKKQSQQTQLEESKNENEQQQEKEKESAQDDKATEDVSQQKQFQENSQQSGNGKSKFFDQGNESDQQNDSQEQENQQQEKEEKKLNKAKQKKLKRQEKQQEGQAPTEKHKCNFCQQVFASKTKLFQHLNETGHQKQVQTVQLEQEKPKSAKQIKAQLQKEQNKKQEKTEEKIEEKREVKKDDVVEERKVREVKKTQEEEKEQLLNDNKQFNQEEADQEEQQGTKFRPQKQKKKKQNTTLSEDQLKCAICKEQFPSKTYFTKHINQTGHKQ